MPVSRREFVRLTAMGATLDVAAGAPGRLDAAARGLRRLKAIAFDAFPIFSPARVASRADELYPGRGAALTEEWRLRQFEYAWLRVLSGRYVDFWQVTGDALVFTARKLQLDLDSNRHDTLMQAFLELAPWPDVVPALGVLMRSGLRLALLSNFTLRMLEENLARSGLRARFDHLLSTDRARTYKPDPRAYALATQAFGLRREEILFVAHAGWDAAGAKSFGYPTYWVNRAGWAPEELGAPPDAVGCELSDLLRFVERARGDAGR